jgi:hypothetical protein
MTHFERTLELQWPIEYVPAPLWLISVALWSINNELWWKVLHLHV